jgi:hypothetical protein
LFSEAFKKLEEATGISDVDGLVNIFVEAENITIHCSAT